MYTNIYMYVYIHIYIPVVNLSSQISFSIYTQTTRISMFPSESLCKNQTKRGTLPATWLKVGLLKATKLLFHVLFLPATTARCPKKRCCHCYRNCPENLET